MSNIWITKLELDWKWCTIKKKILPSTLMLHSFFYSFHVAWHVSSQALQVQLFQTCMNILLRIFWKKWVWLMGLIMNLLDYGNTKSMGTSNCLVTKILVFKRKKKLIQVLHNSSKWWQIVHFWVDYLFKVLTVEETPINS